MKLNFITLQLIFLLLICSGQASKLRLRSRAVEINDVKQQTAQNDHNVDKIASQDKKVDQIQLKQVETVERNVLAPNVDNNIKTEEKQNTQNVNVNSQKIEQKQANDEKQVSNIKQSEPEIKVQNQADNKGFLKDSAKVEKSAVQNDKSAEQQKDLIKEALATPVTNPKENIDPVQPVTVSSALAASASALISAVVNQGKTAEPAQPAQPAQQPAAQPVVNAGYKGTPNYNPKPRSTRTNADLGLDDKWEDASIVNKISNYAKEDLKDINDPEKQNRNLIGKNIYFESGMTFDDSPQWYSSVYPTQLTDVATPKSKLSDEHIGLWKAKSQEPFKSVLYHREGMTASQILAENDNMDLNSMVTAKANVNIIHDMVPSKPAVNYDQDIQTTINPLKNQYFETTMEHSVTMQDPNQQQQPASNENDLLNLQNSIEAENNRLQTAFSSSK